MMIAVATGGPHIGEVYQEFSSLYDAVDDEAIESTGYLFPRPQYY